MGDTRGRSREAKHLAASVACCPPSRASRPWRRYSRPTSTPSLVIGTTRGSPPGR